MLITKKSSANQDSNILEQSFKTFLHAYCESKKTFGGTAYGQHSRYFDRCLSRETKSFSRFEKILEKVRAKHAITIDFEDYVPEVHFIVSQLRSQANGR